MASVFEDVPDWPSAADKRLGMGHNQPPLEESLVMQFQDDLDREGITSRVAELVASAGKVPEITDDIIAGKVGDLCRMASDVEKRIAAAREKHNRPLLNAQRSMKAKADGVINPLQIAIGKVRIRLNAYMAEKARLAREEEEQRRRQAEEARKAAETVAPDVAVQVAPEPVVKPVARGDLGARVGTRKVPKFEIEVPVAKLPKAILEALPVREAIEKVIGQTIRSGNHNIKGVRIWFEDEAVVR